MNLGSCDMKLPQIREYLNKKYTSIDPFPAMFILNNFDDFETIKIICDTIITDMYVLKGLTYLTLEKEDPKLDEPNILRVFSYTRGLDIPTPVLIDDLIEAKYGTRMRFFGKKNSMNTILGWQAPGIWRAGVQFLQYELDHDIVDEVVIEAAIEFSEKLAVAVSSITVEDLWLLKSNLRRATIKEALNAFENLQARYFETCVQEFLRSRYGYTDVITRYKPLYLKGKRLDVYARKGVLGERKTVTLCECKLRFNNKEIKLEEIDDFFNVASKVKKYEEELIAKEGGSLKFETWVITNTTVLPSDLEIIHKNDVRVMIAKLPSNWWKRGDWKIINIEEYII